MPLIEMTDDELQIPTRLANLYRRDALAARVDPDDLLGVATEALVDAWVLFDPARAFNGRAAFGAFAAQRVEWKVRNHLWPGPGRREYHHRGTLSLDALRGPPAEDGGVSLHPFLAARGPDPSARIDAADAVARLLRPLPARHREALLLVLGLGLTLDEVGRRWGVSRERVRQVLAAARARLAWSLGEAPCPNPRGAPLSESTRRHKARTRASHPCDRSPGGGKGAARA